MALPENMLSSSGVAGVFIYPDDQAHSAFLDYEMAGSDIGVGVNGLLVKVWTCFYDEDTGEVRVRPLDDLGPGTLIFTELEISEISFSFDRSMRPAIGYVKENQGYLYWYDTTVTAYVTTELGVIRTIRLTHDDKRTRADQTSDVIVAYIKNDALCYRQQRDRYTIERVLATGLSGDLGLTRVGMTDQFRVEFKVEPMT